MKNGVTEGEYAERFHDSIVISNLSIVVNDINTHTDAEINSEAEILKVECEVNYSVTTQQGTNMLSNQRTQQKVIYQISRQALFAVRDLNLISNFYYLDPAVVSLEGSNSKQVTFMPYVFDSGDEAGKMAEIIVPRRIQYKSDNTFGFALAYGLASQPAPYNWKPAEVRNQTAGMILKWPCEIDGRSLFVYRESVQFTEHDGTVTTKSGFFLCDDYRINSDLHIYGIEDDKGPEVLSNSWMSYNYALNSITAVPEFESRRVAGYGLVPVRRQEERKLEKLIQAIIGVTEIISILSRIFV